MAHTNPPDDTLRRILESAKTIAVVGASNNPAKASHAITRRLIEWGYKVIPVNPGEKEVAGVAAVASLDEIKEPVDIVDVFRRAEDTPPIADAAAKLGAKVLWLQSGISNEETARRASTAGLAVVMDACIKATHDRLDVAPRKG